MSFFPDVICHIIQDYCPIYTVPQWVLDYIYSLDDWEILSSNDKAINILESELNNNPFSTRINLEQLETNVNYDDVFPYLYKNNLPISWKNLDLDYIDITIIEKECKKQDVDLNLINGCYYYDQTTHIIKDIYNNNSNSPMLFWDIICQIDSLADIVRDKYKRQPSSYLLEWDQICSCLWFSDIIHAEYTRDPTSAKLNWNNICMNKNTYKTVYAEYKANRHSTNLIWYHIHYNKNMLNILEEEYKLQNTNNKSYLRWDILCDNYHTAHIVLEEYQRDPRSKNLHFNVIFENESLAEIINIELSKEPQCIYKYISNIIQNNEFTDIIKNIDPKYFNKEIWNRIQWTLEHYDIVFNEYMRDPDSPNIDWGILSIESEYYCNIIKAEYERSEDINDNKRSKSTNDIKWQYICKFGAIEIIETIYNSNPDSKKLYWSEICRRPELKHIIDAEYKRCGPINILVAELNYENIAIIKDQFDKNPSDIKWKNILQSENIFEKSYKHLLDLRW